MDMIAILIPLGIFAGLGLIFGLILAIAAHIFAVKVDPRVPQVQEHLPGANCGGCGYSGCASLADAIVRGDAKPTACTVCDEAATAKIAEIMGVEVGKTVRRRAQVMCSGMGGSAHRKYLYEGAQDCIAAAKLGGGDKQCPNGCIGLGTCVASCSFDAIHMVHGMATVDYEKCVGCGTCVAKCPKNLIELIPYDAKYWVGCRTALPGKITRTLCDAGCISCKLCIRVCESGAITVDSFGAHIDYEKCIACGKCVEKCPRHIIKSGEASK